MPHRSAPGAPGSGAASRTLRSFVLAALALHGCAPAESPEAPAGERPEGAAAAASLPDLLPPGSAAGLSLLLITLDTTRADHLGAYGAEDAGTPNLDRLAARGLRFADAVSPVPMTLPAHATLMTGLDPPEHGVRINGQPLPEAGPPTLAEVLREAGYDTAAFVSSFVLDPRFGLDRGFATYDARLEATRAAAFEPQTERSAGAVTDAAAEWLGARSGGRTPFLLWVHYFDPHDPYEPPEPFASRFRDRPYAGEIAYVDEQVGRLLAALEAEGSAHRTAVVVVADHGESLGEHGERYHSRSLYEGAVRVPLILALPGLPAEGRGAVIGGSVVTLADLFPTLLDLLGLSAPRPVTGRNLLRHGLAPERIVYLETLNTYLDNGWAPLYAARRHGEKYIAAPRPEYYDLAADPAEAQDLLAAAAGEAEERAEPLRRFLERRLAGQPDARAVAAAAVPADPEVRRRLEALGYLSAGEPAAATAEPGDLPDPKDMLPLLEELAEGRRLLAAGRPEEAARKARRLLAGSPADRAALQLLGEAFATLGRLEQAERALRRHHELGPSAGATVLLAQVVMQRGRLDEAEALLDRAAELEPRHGAVAVARGDLELLRRRPEAALAHYREAREIDPYRFDGVARARIERLENLLKR